MAATNQEIIAGLYAAFFNRAPDKDGLTFWERRADAVSGSTQQVFNQIAHGFSLAPKFSEIYGGMTNQQFVEAIYVNLQGFTGDATGIAYWTNVINSGISRSDMVAGFVVSALNFDSNAPSYNNLSAEEIAVAQKRYDTLTNKVNASLAFVEKYGDATNVADLNNIDNDPAYLASIAVLDGITEKPESITTSANKVNLVNGELVTDTTPPVITSSATAPAIDENSGANQTIYTVSATDTNTITYSLKQENDFSLLSINANTGAVTLKDSPDFETKASYAFTVIATDAAGNSSEKSVTLAINDLNDTTPTNTVATVNAISAADNTYKVGDNIAITVTYNEPVTVTGTPTLTLSNGATATYNAGTSTATNLVFDYTVVEGNTDAADLGVTTINLNGGTIKDAGNLDASLTFTPGLMANNNAIVVDANSPTAPTTVTLTPTGGTVTANTLNTSNTHLVAQATITAGEATGGSAVLKIAGTTVATDTTILAGDTTVNFTTSDGTPLNSELQTAIASGGVATVEVTDAAGNMTASTVANPTLLVDYTAPTVSVAPAIASDTTISLTANEVSTAGIYATTGPAASLIGSTVALDGAASANITVAAQGAVTTGTIVVIDTAGNETDSSKVTLGTAGDDTLDTTNSNMLFGFAGQDTLSGGAGVDSLSGGADDDELSFDFGAGINFSGDTLVDGGSGTDTIFSWHGSSGPVTHVDADFANVTNVEALKLSTSNTATVTLGTNTDAAYASGIDITIAAGGTLVVNGSASTVAVNATGDNHADTLTGGSAADSLTGGLGADSIDVGSAVGVIDTVIVAAGDTVLTINGSGDTGTIEGFDTVTNFHAADGTNQSDILDVQGTATVAAAAVSVDGTNSTLTIGGQVIASHSVSNGGVITFDDVDSYTDALTIDSEATLAAAIEYLQRQDIGDAGTSVVIDVGGDNYVYTQGAADGVDNSLDTLVKLIGVQADSLIVANGTGANDLFIA